MLQELFNLLKEHGQDSVINNPLVPNEKNDAVIADATHSVADGLQSELAGGGLQNLISLFSGGANTGTSLMNNPIVSKIVDSFTNKLTTNHGLTGEQANGIAGNLIPSAINSLINRTNDNSNNQFSLNGIISSLTGGAGNSGGFDLGGLISHISGGGSQNSGLATNGEGGISGILQQITSGAKQEQNSGGIMDMIKGLI